MDFVSTSADGYVEWVNGGKTIRANTTSFEFPQIGWMHQGLMQFPGLAPGSTATYKAVSGGQVSATFTVTPDIQGPEKFAVFADL